MPVLNGQIAAVRRFNRFFTRTIGVLDEGHLGSRFSLTEVRVLYELAAGTTSAGQLVRDLDLDEGYVSRMLQRFAKLGIVRRSRSADDARVTALSLTERGRKAFEPLNAKADEAIGKLLGAIPAESRKTVVASMAKIETAFGASAQEPRPVRLREHRAGDMGWIVYRHGALYAKEYGYDERFEAIVARVVSDFLKTHDPQRERCWIAERDGEILGSVMLVKKTATIAKLRLLYLEPEVRGQGLGRRLVDECIAFAREAGYRRVTLWTQSSLTAARHIYESTGFRLVESKAHQDFGPREAAEIWELRLGADRSLRSG